MPGPVFSACHSCLFLPSTLISSPPLPSCLGHGPFLPGLISGDTYIKFDLLRSDGTKAATSRATVRVLGGGEQHGSEL